MYLAAQTRKKNDDSALFFPSENGDFRAAIYEIPKLADTAVASFESAVMIFTMVQTFVTSIVTIPVDADDASQRIIDIIYFVEKEAAQSLVDMMLDKLAPAITASLGDTTAADVVQALADLKDDSEIAIAGGWPGQKPQATQAMIQAALTAPANLSVFESSFKNLILPAILARSPRRSPKAQTRARAPRPRRTPPFPPLTINSSPATPTPSRRSPPNSSDC